MRNIALRQLGCVVILCSCFYAFTQFAAVYFYAWEFQDFVRDQVKFAPFRHGSDESRLFTNIVDAARYYNVQIDPKQIKISRTATIPGMMWTTLAVDVTYTALVDLNWFKKPLHFHTSATTQF